MTDQVMMESIPNGETNFHSPEMRPRSMGLVPKSNLTRNRFFSINSKIVDFRTIDENQKSENKEDKVFEEKDEVLDIDHLDLKSDNNEKHQTIDHSDVNGEMKQNVRNNMDSIDFDENEFDKPHGDHQDIVDNENLQDDIDHHKLEVEGQMDNILKDLNSMDNEERLIVKSQQSDFDLKRFRPGFVEDYPAPKLNMVDSFDKLIFQLDDIIGDSVKEEKTNELDTNDEPHDNISTETEFDIEEKKRRYN